MIEEAKALVDALQHQAYTLIDQTQMEPEKEEVIALITTLQQQVAEQSNAAMKRSEELDEAIRPWEIYHEALAKVTAWMYKHMPVVGQDLVTTNPNLVQRQLTEHRVRLKLLTLSTWVSTAQDKSNM